MNAVQLPPRWFLFSVILIRFFLRVPNGFFRVRSCFHPVVGEVIRGLFRVEIKQSARSVEDRSRRWNLVVWTKKGGTIFGVHQTHPA